MKPYLKNGRPVYQYIQRREREIDSPIFVCWCDLCAESNQLVLLPGGIPETGRYFYNDYDAKQHQSLLRGLARQSVHASTLSSPSQASQANSSSILTTSTIFEPPVPVTPSTSFPIYAPELPANTSLQDQSEDFIADSQSTPTTRVPYTLLAYEYQRLEEISSHLADLEADPRRYWNTADLQFNQDPVTSYPEGEDFTSLLTDHPTNTLFKGHLEWLHGSEVNLNELARHKKLSSSFSCKHTVVKRALDREFENTRRRLREEWVHRQKLSLLNQRYIHLSSHHGETVKPEHQIFLVILMVVAVLHLIYDLSMIPTAFLVGSMRLICGTMGHDPKQIKLHLPQDARVVIDRLALSPAYTTWACCPRCFQLYPLADYPDFCTNKAASGSTPCGRRLKSIPEKEDLGKSQPCSKLRPTRSYSQQNLDEWIAFMHNRRDIEPYLQRPYDPNPPADGAVSDIWDSDFLRHFRGPDNQSLFLSPDNPRENRLIFNLNQDSFNPYGNRKAGKIGSVGGLYLVCLNLPPSIRYRPENIFLVGVIPGPKEPSAHQINYILRPLVDDLERLWKDGIYISRTSLHPTGRSVRAALVALVCDMPAARLMGGFAHHMSSNNPCSMCKTSNLNDLDAHSFLRRTGQEHREMAEAWLRAETEDERNILYNNNGVRWSELLRLEYWDPVQNTVIDPMHGFYLRNFQRHCRQIWGMSVSLTDCDGLWDIKLPDQEGKSHADAIFKHGTNSDIRHLNADSIRYLAIQEGLDYRRSTKALKDALVQLRVIKVWKTPARPLDDPDPEQPASRAPPSSGGATSHQPSKLPDIEPEDQTLCEARMVYVQGAPKKMLNRYEKPIIQKLAAEFQVQVKTKTGQISEDKKKIIDALVSQRKLGTHNLNVADPPASLAVIAGIANVDSVSANYTSNQNLAAPQLSGATAPISVQSSVAQNDPAYLFRNASKSRIQKMNCADVVRIFMVAIEKHQELRAQKQAERDITAPQPIPNEAETTGDRGDDFDVSDSEGSLGSDDTPGVMYDDESSYSSDEEIPLPTTKKGFCEFIHDTRRKIGLTDQDGSLLKNSKSGRAGVLGKETLAAIREDMSKIQTPSWLSAAPSRPGEASQGKFTADQWRTFCTVHLPITLIRLWGSLPATDRKHQMLVNFMHLVTAVRLATMRVMTEERVRRFEYHTRTYLEELIGFGQLDRVGGLYPHTSITPYQHMMLHFGHLLRRFGPVHSWRCFAFERFNYILQTTSTNQRFGELEQTMFMRFCRMQKLKALFHNEEQSSLVHSLATLYQDTFESIDTRGSRISDALAYEEDPPDTIDDVTSWPSAFVQRLDHDTYNLLGQWKPTDGSFLTSAQPHRKVKQRGAIFAPQRHSFANAQVIVDSRGTERWTAGSIQEIFTAVWRTLDGKHHGKTFAKISVYKALDGDDLEHDHYRKFGFSGGRLFYDELESASVLIPLNNVISHFAHTLQPQTPIRDPIVHVLPLNKVWIF